MGKKLYITCKTRDHGEKKVERLVYYRRRMCRERVRKIDEIPMRTPERLLQTYIPPSITGRADGNGDSRETRKADVVASKIFIFATTNRGHWASELHAEKNFQHPASISIFILITPESSSQDTYLFHQIQDKSSRYQIQGIREARGTSHCPNRPPRFTVPRRRPTRVETL